MIKKEFNQSICATLHEFSDLEPQEQELIKSAIHARTKAQAPYSNFTVGVAVVSAQGTTHHGCNVERCTWTQTTHAEQNAVDSMISQCGPVKITLIALAGAPANHSIELNKKPSTSCITKPEEATLPCGHCRQIIWENCLEDPTVKILALTKHGDVLVTTIGDIYPMRFGPEHLGITYQTSNQP